MPGTILLATDGSEHAARAARHALDLARERDATLHVLCVVDSQIVPEPGLSSAELATIVMEEHGHKCVAEVGRLAEDTGVVVEGKYCHGVPHELILDYAEEIDADAIVIGKHGDHTRHLGGVGRKLARQSPREVVVVDFED